MTASTRYAAAFAAALGCVSPNLLAQTCAVDLLTDPSGDYDGLPLPAAAPAGLPEHDLLGLSLAQSGSGEDTALTFTLKTAGFSGPALPPNAAWFASFENADGSIYGVRLQSDPTGTGSYFSYRPGANNAGGVDGRFVEAGTEKPAEGSFTADGTITITIKASAVNMEPGTGLGPFNGGTVQSVPQGLIAAVVDGMPAGDLSRDGFFDGCAAKAGAGASSAILATGALPATSLLILAAGLLARRRRFR